MKHSANGILSVMLLICFLFVTEEIEASDPSICTGVGVRSSNLVGNRHYNGAQTQAVLEIPVGQRLEQIYVASGRWITGISFTFSNGESKSWGYQHDDREQTYELKEGEYIAAITVRVGAHIDWLNKAAARRRSSGALGGDGKFIVSR